MPAQIVEIPFGGGVNEDVDDRLLPQPFLLDMRNAEFDKQGALNRRSGHLAIPQAQFGLTDGLDISTTPPVRLARWRDSLAMVTRVGLYLYEPVVDLWSLAYYFTPALPARAPIARDVSRSLMDGDVATTNGYEAHVWRDADGSGGFGIYYQVFERDSRAPVSAVNGAMPGFLVYMPHVVAVGTNFIFIWMVNNGGVRELRMRQFDTATLVVHADVVLANDVNVATYRIDAAPLDGDNFLVAYFRTDRRVTALRITLSTAITQIRALALVTSDPDSLAICGTAGENVYCAWNDSGAADSTRLGILDAASFTVLTASTAVTPGTHVAPQIGVCRASSTSAHVVWEQTSSPRSLVCHREMSNAGAGVTALQTRFGFNLQGKPFAYGSDPIVSGQQAGAYVLVGYRSDVQGCLHLLRLAPSYLWGMEVGTFAPRESGDERTICHLSGVAEVRTGRFRVSATVKTRVLATATSTFLLGTTGIDYVEVDFTPDLADDTRALAFEASENLWIAGARPTFFDGRFPIPAAFQFSPDDIDTGGLPLAGGGLLSAGAYQYVAVFELQDTRGNLLRSEVLSPPITVTVALNDRATLTIPGAPVTPIPQGRTMTRLYRTLVNQSGPFFRVTSVPGAGGTTNVTIVDGAEDAVIAVNEAVYTDGGVLPNVQPPPSATIAVIEDRVFLADGRDVWYSKQFVPGEIPGWSEQLVFRVEQGGDILAIAQMDDAPILFKRSSIFQVGGGEGFGDDGSGTNFKAKPIATGGVGLVDPRSIVLGPDGLYFKAEAGIYCLTRGLEVVFIGQPVRDHVRDLYPTVTSATLIPEKQQVIWTLSNGIEGRAVIYDYRRQQWAIAEIEGGAIITTACFLDGTYYYATAAGVRRSDPDTWVDAGTPYTMSAKTAWIKVAGIQGYKQVRRATFLLKNRGAHELSISVLTNYNGSILSEGYTWTAAELAALPDEQVSIHLRNQKCQAIAFEIADDASAGESCVIESIRLEVEVKRTGARQLLPAGARK